MLMQTIGENRSSKPPTGVLNSPILARVERVLLRHDQDFNSKRAHLQRSDYTQSLFSSSFEKESTATIKRGLLWQQRKKLFSRWKERYFILTRDYLYCFQRASGADKITEMGQFLFKVKLVDIERVEWENKKSHSIVGLVLGRDGILYLRSPNGLEDWFELIEDCVIMSKEKRKASRHSHDAKLKNDNSTMSSSLAEWMYNRKFAVQQPSQNNEGQPTIRKRHRSPGDEHWEHSTFDHRLSLLTDIDVSTYDDNTVENPPSLASYRINRDVMCTQLLSSRSRCSSRSTRESSSNTRWNSYKIDDNQFMKFRERSYSDIPKESRHTWKKSSDNNAEGQQFIKIQY